MLGLVGIEYGHAVDGRGFLGGCLRVHHVVGADDQGHVGILEVPIDVIELEDHVLGNARLGQQHVHLDGHAAGHRVYCEPHIDARCRQQLDDIIELGLRLGCRQAVAGDDDDTVAAIGYATMVGALGLNIPGS